MAADFPVSIPAIPRVSQADHMDDSGKEGDVLHNRICDEVEALAATIGVTGSAVDGTIHRRLTDIKNTADSAVVDTRLADWGLKTDPVTGIPIMPPPVQTNLISYFWRWPGSNGTARYLEDHLYVPAGQHNEYFGTIFGVRTKGAYMVPAEASMGMFKPGLYTLAASCTKTGTWSAPSNAAALTGAYAASTAAGSTISANVTGATLAVHQFMATNGGHAIVSVDGSYDFSSPLPVFTNDDAVNNRCRPGDVGKRYLSFYLNDSWSHAQVVAEGLSEASHTLSLEVTGTKPAASSDVRVVVEALVGCSIAASCLNQNTHMVPTRRFVELLTPGFSSTCCVPMFAPSGSQNFLFIGASHADNSASKEVSVSGPIVTINGVVTSPTPGTYYSGLSIFWYQESTVSHAANLATQVLNKKRLYSACANRPCQIMADVKMTWLVDGTVEIFYPLMYPLGAYDFQRRSTPALTPVRAWIGSRKLELSDFDSDDDSTTVFGSQYSAGALNVPLLAMQYADCMTWATVVHEDPRYGGMFSGLRSVSLHDRADGIDKLYACSNYDGFIPIKQNDVGRYIVGWGGMMSADFP